MEKSSHKKPFHHAVNYCHADKIKSRIIITDPSPTHLHEADVVLVPSLQSVDHTHFTFDTTHLNTEEGGNIETSPSNMNSCHGNLCLLVHKHLRMDLETGTCVYKYMTLLYKLCRLAYNYS